MLTKKNIIKAIIDSREEIKKYGVKRIGIFGSYVKSMQREGSDIDALVEFEKDKKSFDNYMELKFFLQDLLGCKVDLVIKDALKREIKPHVIKEVEYARL